MRQLTFLILGIFDSSNPTHLATRDALHHAAGKAGVVANTRWMGPDDVGFYPGLVADSSAVILAPDTAGPGRPLPRAFLETLQKVREKKIPFLATGNPHALVLVELARNLLDIEDAGGECIGVEGTHAVVTPIEGLHSPDHPQPSRIEMIYPDPDLCREIFGRDLPVHEETDVRCGLDPDYAAALEEKGLQPLALEKHSRRPLLFRLRDHPCHLTAGYLPQLSSTPETPHPIFETLLNSVPA